MRYSLFFLAAILLVIGCGTSTKKNTTTQQADVNKSVYLQQLEVDNNISYEEIKNTRGAYITSMCYTKTQDEKSGNISNPCYSCHTKGKIPNYYNDTNLQQEYNFPEEVRKNPFSNLFRDRSNAVGKITDSEILDYIRDSNYFDKNGKITLASVLPSDWQGYRPDCYYNFDDEGFDRDPNKNYTLWRAFRYYPFLGTFWPTNGSTDDVLIRLAPEFSQNESGIFDIEIYKLNLSIVEALTKQKNVQLSSVVDENKYGVDLNQNGILDSANEIIIASYDKMSYVGKAKAQLAEGKLHIAPGLFPEGTEFLHSVRYVDWDEKSGHIAMSKRMKELRYAKKYGWSTYSEIERVAQAELNEALANGSNEAILANFRGDYENGLDNDISWKYQGFIEDKNGNLRPQTHEETIGCMGCHSHLGATTDSIFSFARKLEGSNKSSSDFGWNHWTQKGLVGVKEPQVNYKNFGKQYEYSFYLNNNHSGNEFRNNDEVQAKFFNSDTTVKSEMLDKLHNDISVLLFPSKSRALALDKGYKVMVEEQSYIYGRDANVKPMDNVYQEELQFDRTTSIDQVIVRDD
ncbi:MAG: hypothetical protein IE887_06505 [Campylobacterales bacterium]|nr:hypothetical protein [Campylobacterales bacterium]